ncbi:MAG: low molecular weight phosphatase family protein [Burkholderiales bacterium]
MRIIGTVIALALCLGATAGNAASSQEPGARPATAKAPTVLFMCPHGAAKSVLASAYFQRLAKERGLNVQVRSAGTDPDPQISPAVARHLKKDGYDVPVAKPRRATADDMASADVVISIGCDLKDLPSPRGALLKWDDVPSTTDEFARADEKIRERVVALIDELVRKQNRQ